MPRRRKNKNPVCPPPTPKESCKYCHKSNLKLSKCSRCKEVFYCSVDCQKKDWVNHNNVCETKTSVQQQSPDPPLPGKAVGPRNPHEMKVSSSSASIQQTSKNSCKYCHKSNLKLSKCSRCKEIFYCSIDCQKKDWVSHKKACKPKTSEQQQSTDPPLPGKAVGPLNPPDMKVQSSSASIQQTSKNSCKYCHKPNLKLSKCSRCKEVFYCSIDCQKKDWVSHKKACKPQTSEQQQSTDPPLPGKEESCNHCGKSSDVKLRTCSQCHQVKYCSKKCQKAEWPNHKLDCQKKQTKCSNCFRICKEDSKYCNRCILRRFFEIDDYISTIAKYASVAKMRFPKLQVITKYEDISQIHPIFDFLPNMQVLVVQMYRFGNHPFRASMIVLDATGKCYHLIFYLNFIEEVIFPWDEFQPGNYICIKFPQVHLFLDGTIGFRIESLNEVSFIEAF